MSTAPSSTVLKAFELLELFADHPLLGAAECARLLGTPRATAHRLLVSLKEAGAVESTAAGHYRLSLHMFQLGSLVPLRRRLHEGAHAALEELVDRTGLPAHLGALNGTRVLYLEKAHRARDRIPTDVGVDGPLHATALGKALLAHAGTDVVSQVVAEGLRRYTPTTIVDDGCLYEELACIRASGFAYDREEMTPGIICIAVPIRDHVGRVVATLSIPAPAARGRHHLDSLRTPLLEARASIQRRLGSSAAGHRTTLADPAVAVAGERR